MTYESANDMLKTAIEEKDQRLKMYEGQEINMGKGGLNDEQAGALMIENNDLKSKISTLND